MPEYKVGYSIPDGNPITVPITHTAIFGLTHESGKTTTLEACTKRIDGNPSVIVFRTKRRDIGFSVMRRVDYYFREHIDWRFIEGLIAAHLQERAKQYRSNIMMACRGATTLHQVWDNINEALGKTKNGWLTSIYTELNQYLSEIVPALESMHFAPDVYLEKSAVNVMNLEPLAPALQQLIIASTIDRIMETMSNVIVVLPEAKDFIPNGTNTPAKKSLENLVRKGATLGNYLWCDSQSLTGLDMDVMRNVGTWLFGKQFLDIEAKRNAKMIPGNAVTPHDITALGKGQFYLVRGEDVHKVYVQPVFINDEDAMAIARGEKDVNDFTIDDLRNPDKYENTTEIRTDPGYTDIHNADDMNTVKELTRETLELKKQIEAKDAEIAKLNNERDELMAGLKNLPPSYPALDPQAPDEIEINNKEIRVSIIDQGPEVRQFNTSNVPGKIMLVVVKDIPYQQATESTITEAMRERGWNHDHGVISPAITNLVKKGNLMKINGRPAIFRLPGKVKFEVNEANENGSNNIQTGK